LEAVRVLLESGADSLATNHKGRTPVDWAAGSGQMESLRLLVDQFAKEGKTNVKEEHARSVKSHRSGGHGGGNVSGHTTPHGTARGHDRGDYSGGGRADGDRDRRDRDRDGDRDGDRYPSRGQTPSQQEYSPDDARRTPDGYYESSSATFTPGRAASRQREYDVQRENRAERHRRRNHPDDHHSERDGGERSERGHRERGGERAERVERRAQQHRTPGQHRRNHHDHREGYASSNDTERTPPQPFSELSPAQMSATPSASPFSCMAAFFGGPSSSTISMSPLPPAAASAAMASPFNCNYAFPSPAAAARPPRTPNTAVDGRNDVRRDRDRDRL
jgi:hypothetical protein